MRRPPRYLISFIFQVTLAMPVPKGPTIWIDNSRPVIPVRLSIPVPTLSTILIYKSRPAIPMNSTVLVPLLLTIWIYDSRPAFPMKLTIIITDYIPSVFKLATGLEDRRYGFPVI
jgi:hypothetical protein